MFLEIYVCIKVKKNKWGFSRKTFAAFPVRKILCILKFWLRIYCDPCMFTFGGLFPQKNATQAHCLFTSTGKRRCCLLNVMVYM